MPAFKFENQWLDAKFNHFNGSSEDNDRSSSSDPLKPVFSGYGVVYLLVSALMTGITVGAYFWAKRKRAEDDDEIGVVRVFMKENQQLTRVSNPLVESGRPNPGKGSGGASDASSLLASSQSFLGLRGRFQKLDILGTIKSWYIWLCQVWVHLVARARRVRNRPPAANSPV